MASDTRDKMIEGAALLLAKRGLQETSFSEVLELTGAPRGSIYHHFPQGKDQLVGSAVDFAGDRAIRLLRTRSGSPARDVAEFFLALWRDVLVRSDFHAGCSVLAVTIATDSPSLLEHAAVVFRNWESSLTELFTDGGLAPDDAARYATFLIASSEGAVVLSRAARSMVPFESVAAQVLEYLESFPRTAEPG